MAGPAGGELGAEDGVSVGVGLMSPGAGVDGAAEDGEAVRLADAELDGFGDDADDDDEHAAMPAAASTTNGHTTVCLSRMTLPSFR